MKKLKLKLLSDPDMYIFFEKGMGGGVLSDSKQSSESKQKLKHIYLDGNNICGYAMPKFLPKSSFKRIDPKEFDLSKYINYSSKGCVLKVVLEYPKELQELHNDYTLDQQ